MDSTTEEERTAGDWQAELPASEDCSSRRSKSRSRSRSRDRECDERSAGSGNGNNVESPPSRTADGDKGEDKDSLQSRLQTLSKEPAVELTPEEQEMMNVMGFAAFNSSKKPFEERNLFEDDENEAQDRGRGGFRGRRAGGGSRGYGGRDRDRGDRDSYHDRGDSYRSHGGDSYRDRSRDGHRDRSDSGRDRHSDRDRRSDYDHDRRDRRDRDHDRSHSRR